MATLIHADDFGITLAQAEALLRLSDGCGGRGALTSVSMFANSPAFEASASMAMPFVESGTLKCSLHLNVVEGRPCANVRDVAMLVDSRGFFNRDFIGLMAMSLRGSSLRDQLKRQVAREFRAQIRIFLSSFPDQQGCLRIDSHQHTHMIPVVFDALLDAVRAEGCHLRTVRVPAEPLRPHLRHASSARNLTAANLAKREALCRLARSNLKRLPSNCATPLFCGVVLSGRMDRFDGGLLEGFENLARKRGQDLEVLFHPVSVPAEECLDPDNAPFANACASPARDAEAATVRLIGEHVSGSLRHGDQTA